MLVHNILITRAPRHTEPGTGYDIPKICLSTTSGNHTINHVRGTDKTIHNQPGTMFPLSILTAYNTSVNCSCEQAPPPSRATAGHLPALSVPGVGHLQILRCPGSGICQPRTFDTHAVSYQNITTQRILLESKQIDLFVMHGKKLKRFVKACSRFYACISSLLIKPE